MAFYVESRVEGPADAGRAVPLRIRLQPDPTYALPSSDETLAWHARQGTTAKNRLSRRDG
jgi:hypothetical protein